MSKTKTVTSPPREGEPTGTGESKKKKKITVIIVIIIIIIILANSIFFFVFFYTVTTLSTLKNFFLSVPLQLKAASETIIDKLEEVILATLSSKIKQ